jgi:signal transduction histidine kinase
LRDEIVRLAEAALGARAVVVGDGAGALQVEWPAGEEPDADRQALADGIAELATRALERADLQAREADARLQRTLAEELSREREALVYQILHDLRNPVQAIALMNMDLAHRAEDEPDLADSVAAIERQVAFMGAFLKQKLDRLAGRASGESADLAPVLADLAHRFEPLSKPKGLMLNIQGTGTARLALPPVELAQILGNLLDNAVKFTPSGGSVALEAEMANGWATLTVRDTGPGIGPSHAPGSDGYGIGNGHVRHLVRQAGGWVKWEGSPAGTVVRLGLPTEDWGKLEPVSER